MAKARKKEVHKIVEGLKEAVEYAQQPQTAYDRIADRVLKATKEFNDALDEAHKCAEMRVFIGYVGRGEETPMQVQPQIYKLTHSTLVFTVKYAVDPNAGAGEKPVWQQVKNSIFKDAAGQGLSALKKR